VFGPIVIVQSESSAPVYFKKIDRPGSVDPSAIVVVCVLAFVVMASVPKLKASAISSKFVFDLLQSLNNLASGWLKRLHSLASGWYLSLRILKP
jgi:hypothetical protein